MQLLSDSAAQAVSVKRPQVVGGNRLALALFGANFCAAAALLRSLSSPSSNCPQHALLLQHADAANKTHRRGAAIQRVPRGAYDRRCRTTRGAHAGDEGPLRPPRARAGRVRRAGRRRLLAPPNSTPRRRRACRRCRRPRRGARRRAAARRRAPPTSCRGARAARASCCRRRRARGGEPRLVGRLELRGPAEVVAFAPRRPPRHLVAEGSLSAEQATRLRALGTLQSALSGAAARTTPRSPAAPSSSPTSSPAATAAAPAAAPAAEDDAAAAEGRAGGGGGGARRRARRRAGAAGVGGGGGAARRAAGCPRAVAERLQLFRRIGALIEPTGTTSTGKDARADSTRASRGLMPLHRRARHDYKLHAARQARAPLGGAPVARRLLPASAQGAPKASKGRARRGGCRVVRRCAEQARRQAADQGPRAARPAEVSSRRVIACAVGAVARDVACRRTAAS